MTKMIVVMMIVALACVLEKGVKTAVLRIWRSRGEGREDIGDDVEQSLLNLIITLVIFIIILVILIFTLVNLIISFVNFILILVNLIITLVNDFFWLILLVARYNP